MRNARIRFLSVTIVAALALTDGLATAQPDVAAVNDRPNPYTTIEGWAKMPAGRTWGSTSAVDIAADGTIWVAERCGANTCMESDLDPVLHFDKQGNLIKSFGKGLIGSPHGIAVDAGGNVWITDWQDNAPQPPRPTTDEERAAARRERGAAEPGYFYHPSDVLIAPDGHIFVADGHGEGAARILKFTADGTLVKTWGKKGSANGEFDGDHALAMDSQGRLFVGDRSNNRVQIFDQDGTFIDVWYQFGRPSGVFIDANDMLYVADSESGSVAPGQKTWKRGIRIGSAKTGEVMYLIPDPDEDATGTSAAEGVAVDQAGNVYGAEVGPRALKKYVKQ